MKARFASIIAAALLTPAAWGVTIGQLDDFEDGTTEGWIVNLLGMGSPPTPPVNIPDGGPSGPGDAFLQLTSVGGGGGPNSRMVALNPDPRWAGDYISTGVGYVSMDVNNLGPTDLYVRMLFEDPGLGPPTNIAFSRNAIFLPAGSGWTTVRLPVYQSALTAGLGTVSGALSNVTLARLFSSPTPIFPPDTIEGVLGVDNIGVEAVPEPTTWATLAAGALALAALKRRRRSKP